MSNNNDTASEINQATTSLPIVNSAAFEEVGEGSGISYIQKNEDDEDLTNLDINHSNPPQIDSALEESNQTDPIVEEGGYNGWGTLDDKTQKIFEPLKDELLENPEAFVAFLRIARGYNKIEGSILKYDAKLTEVQSSLSEAQEEGRKTRNTLTTSLCLIGAIVALFGAGYYQAKSRMDGLYKQNAALAQGLNESQRNQADLLAGLEGKIDDVVTAKLRPDAVIVKGDGTYQAGVETVDVNTNNKQVTALGYQPAATTGLDTTGKQVTEEKYQAAVGPTGLDTNGEQVNTPGYQQPAVVPSSVSTNGEHVTAKVVYQPAATTGLDTNGDTITGNQGTLETVVQTGQEKQQESYTITIPQNVENPYKAIVDAYNRANKENASAEDKQYFIKFADTYRSELSRVQQNRVSKWMRMMR